MASLITELYYAFLEPALCHLRLASPGGGDPTYGRARLPHSDVENACIYKNPRVTATHHTVPLNSQAMRKGGVWAREGSQWVAYYVWEIKEAVERENCELYIHASDDVYLCARRCSHGNGNPSRPCFDSLDEIQ